MMTDTERAISFFENALENCVMVARKPFETALDALRHTADYDKAREEGRLVELPEPRKALVWGDDDHDSVLCPDCGKDLMGIPYGERMVLQCPECGQYLDATMENVLTRQEAEAALGGGEDD